LTSIPFTAADPNNTVAVRTETSGGVSSEKTFRAKDPHRFAKIGTTSAGSQRPFRIQRHRSSRMRSAGPRLPCRAIFGSAPDAVGGTHHLNAHSAISTDIPRIPCTLAVIFHIHQGRRKEIRTQPAPFAAKSSGCSPGEAATHCFASIEAVLSRRRQSHLTPGIHHAGAGGDRNRAINERISWNICRGTATSAIWKVT